MVGTMLPRSCKAWSGPHDAYLEETLKQGWRRAESWFVNVCVLLNNPRYIFIVWRLSILSKLDSNKPYHIWAELYFPNLNYLIILDTWPSFWFSQIMAITSTQFNLVHRGQTISPQSTQTGATTLELRIWHRTALNLPIQYSQLFPSCPAWSRINQ
jgi:hypothetical protein